MKPLLLKIEGLNSFRKEQTVDFTKLSETGLFGIFGPTGSGKSTILDGITLALYGKVERAKGRAQGIINQHEERTYVQFTFSVGKKKYIAERSFKRNNEGGVNLHKCRLLEMVDETEQVIAEKQGDMDKKITEIIGLTFEDFTRAVVLPQGKFAEFLSLQGKDRRLMLQRIFSLEKYGVKLYEKVKSRLNSAKNELKLVCGMQSELGDASEKALIKAKEELKKQETVVLELKQLEKSYGKRYEELKKIIELKRELEKAQKEWEDIKVLEPSFQLKLQRLELAHKAEKVKPYCQVVNNEKLALDKICAHLANLTEEVNNLENILAATLKVYQELENKKNTRGKELEIKLVKLEQALAEEKLRQELLEKREGLKKDYLAAKKAGESLKAQQKELENLRSRLQVKKAELAKIIQQKEQIAQLEEVFAAKKEAWQEFKESEKIYNELIQDVKEKETQVEGVIRKISLLLKEKEEINKELLKKKQEMDTLPVPELTQDELNTAQKELNDYSEVISSLEYYLADLDAQEKDFSQFQKEINLVLENLKTEESTINTLTDRKQLLTQEIANLDKDFKELQSKNLALFLRKKLEENKPCPVCGSLVHVIPEEEEEKPLKKLEEVIQQKQEELKQVEEHLNQSLNKESSLKSKLELLEENQRKIREIQNNLINKIKEQRNKLQPEWLSWDVKDLKTWQNQRKRYLIQAQEQISTYAQVKEKYIEQLADINNKLNSVEQSLAREEANRDFLNETLKQGREKLEIISLDKEKKEKFFYEKAEGMTGSEIEEKVQEIKKARQDLILLRKKEAEIAKQLEQTTESLFKVQEELQKNLQRLESLEVEGKGYKQQIDQLTARINEVTFGNKAEDVKQKVEEELRALKDSLEKAAQQLEKNRLNYEEKKNLYSNLSHEKKKTEERLEKALQELAEKIKVLQFSSQVEAEEALLTPEEMALLEKEIQEFKNKKLLVQKNLESLKNKLGDKDIEEEEWQSFLQEMERNREELEKSQELYHKLIGHVERLETNNIRWRQLEEEKKHWEELLDKLTELEKLFRGNAFVEFIAEEQLINVSLDASRILADLTQSRYALIVDSDGGFIIRDDANGGLYRPVSTLSGGETFLTSLALALALSSQIQIRGKYPLEFFFLDEGFGTLDRDLLETVMDSLEKLQSQKMTVGVISHVPELRARLQRRLIVTPAENGGKGTQLEIEVG